MTFDFKSAKPADRKREYDRIAKEIGDDRFFTRKELNHLPEVLSSGEQVLAFTSGLMDGNTWLVTLTDRRIIFLDKGMIYGLKQTAIDLDKVNSVSGHTGMLLGKIAIEDGASERVISNVWKKTVVAFTNKVRDAIEARKTALRPAPVLAAPVDDVVSKLERLAALLDKGVIDRAEFDRQKAGSWRSRGSCCDRAGPSAACWRVFLPRPPPEIRARLVDAGDRSSGAGRGCHRFRLGRCALAAMGFLMLLPANSWWQGSAVYMALERKVDRAFCLSDT